MSEITSHERPGVYSSYAVSSLTAAARGGGAVAVAAQGGTEQCYVWTSYSRAVADVGVCTLSELARLVLKNGAGKVYGIPAGADYDAAFAYAAGLEDVAAVVCDSTDLSVQKSMMQTVTECSAAGKERIAVAAGADGETVESLIARAAALNCERVVLTAPGGIGAAAAMAGAIAGSSDPALPLSGGELAGVEELSAVYGNNEIDLLVRGGVTPLETVGNRCFVVRAVTTRTTTDGIADTAWRELTTVTVADDVIPGIRRALSLRFRRTKNNSRTRGAIRSLVVLELENRVRAEIIDSYEDVTVEASPEDPTVCLVEFAFTVTHGLNQIWLSAHITV